MKEIKLTQGKLVQIDDWNYDWLNQWKWHAVKYRNSFTFYAVRSTSRIYGKQKTIFMHREIMSTPNNKEVDHGDHNGLNCQEYNMKNCVHQENCFNTLPSGISGYLGVDYINIGKYKYIRATIKKNGKKIHLGCYKTEEAAAKARDQASIKYFGEFANLNFK